MQDITAELKIENLNPRELVALISSFFENRIQVSKNEIVFSKINAHGCLKINFSKSHSIMSILRSSQLTDADLSQIGEKIKSELTDESTIKIGREIIFSGFPIKGFFKFKDDFQILPVPHNAPNVAQSSGLSFEHPAIIEFRFRASQNFEVNSYRRNQAVSKFATILSSLLKGRIKIKSYKLQTRWVLSKNTSTGNQEPAILLEGYNYDGFKNLDTQFSSVNGIDPIASVPPQEYFNTERILVGTPLSIPATLDDLISKYLSLPFSSQDKYFRAAYWFDQSKELYLTSLSASYLAAIMAIETLVEEEYSNNRCPTCKKSQGKGPTIKFRDFLGKFAAASGPNQDDFNDVLKRLYEIRSKLAHGGGLLIDDAEHHYIAWYSTQWQEERNKTDILFHLTQIALVNWLNHQIA